MQQIQLRSVRDPPATLVPPWVWPSPWTHLANLFACTALRTLVHVSSRRAVEALVQSMAGDHDDEDDDQNSCLAAIQDLDRLQSEFLATVGLYTATNVTSHEGFPTTLPQSLSEDLVMELLGIILLPREPLESCLGDSLTRAIGQGRDLDEAAVEQFSVHISATAPLLAEYLANELELVVPTVLMVGIQVPNFSGSPGRGATRPRSRRQSTVTDVLLAPSSDVLALVEKYHWGVPHISSPQLSPATASVGGPGLVAVAAPTNAANVAPTQPAGRVQYTIDPRTAWPRRTFPGLSSRSPPSLSSSSGSSPASAHAVASTRAAEAIRDRHHRRELARLMVEHGGGTDTAKSTSGSMDEMGSNDQELAIPPVRIKWTGTAPFASHPAVGVPMAVRARVRAAAASPEATWHAARDAADRGKNAPVSHPPWRRNLGPSSSSSTKEGSTKAVPSAAPYVSAWYLPPGVWANVQGERERERERNRQCGVAPSVFQRRSGQLADRIQGFVAREQAAVKSAAWPSDGQLSGSAAGSQLTFSATRLDRRARA
ncbi:hypothetical protein BC828DRAFT_385883 [Blastocladiella britannica]|nr:hypothetical protein BC828DRAFT_385883 [Blastocladiella britannica]